jgi:hypothetical protein
MTTASPFVRLKGSLQPAPYGKEGWNSRAARFACATGDFKVDENQPYGEVHISQSISLAETLTEFA